MFFSFLGTCEQKKAFLSHEFELRAYDNLVIQLKTQRVSQF